jgi:hypothetical protein
MTMTSELVEISSSVLAGTDASKTPPRSRQKIKLLCLHVAEKFGGKKAWRTLCGEILAGRVPYGERAIFFRSNLWRLPSSFLSQSLIAYRPTNAHHYHPLLVITKI